MADISVSTRAYCKLILHAAKYPHRAVNGVLLAEKNKGKEPKSVKFVDAIPLFHLTLGLAPMLEVALTQIDAYCRTQNLVVGGYYQGNENIFDRGPNLIAQKIADKIHEYFSDACLFMIENDQLGIDCVEEALSVYQHTESGWTCKKDQSNLLEKTALEITSTSLQSKLYRELNDFDNHLDDIELDWRNPFINEQLSLST